MQKSFTCTSTDPTSFSSTETGPRQVSRGAGLVLVFLPERELRPIGLLRPELHAMGERSRPAANVGLAGHGSSFDEVGYKSSFDEAHAWGGEEVRRGG